MQKNRLVAVIIVSTLFLITESNAQPVVGTVGNTSQPIETSSCPRAVQLSTQVAYAGQNRTRIQNLLMAGRHVRIPKGKFPVLPLTIYSGSRISGCGMGISELYLAATEDHPVSGRRTEHVIGTERVTSSNNYTDNISINDLTINGSAFASGMVWGSGDGNAYGLFIRACRNSMFRNLEVKNCWTDGIHISTVYDPSTTFTNNCENCQFENIRLTHCGRQGVSVAGGKNIVLNNFVVKSIGKDFFGKSPKAALDIEPLGGQTVERVSVSNWAIRRCGRGVIANGVASPNPIDGVVISNITCQDLTTAQFLSGENVTGMTIANATCRDFWPALPSDNNFPLCVRFKNAKAQVTNLSLANVKAAKYAISVHNDSDLVFGNVVIDGCDGGVLDVGGTPGTPVASSTSVKLSEFRFRNISRTPTSFHRDMNPFDAAMFVNSSGDVNIADGSIKISDEPNVPVANTAELRTNAKFENCNFDSGDDDVFKSDESGQAIGLSNSWNRTTKLVVGQNTAESSHYCSLIRVMSSNSTIEILPQLAWAGSEVFVSHGGNANPTVNVSAPNYTIHGPAAITTQNGGLVLRFDGQDWFSAPVGEFVP